MSEPAVATASTPAIPERASFWEDLIDIFYQPSAVFARRRMASAWPPYLFVVIAMAVITIATYNVLEPAITADMQRAMQKAMEHNPQMTQELADKGCAWADTACLWKIKSSDGRGPEILTSTSKKLTAAEKDAFNAAARKYNDC